MKKALSLLLALIMSLSVCAAVPAYAYDYECYAIPHGKYGADPVTFFVRQLNSVNGIEGCEEVSALLSKSYEKCRATQDKLREVLAAVAEVEKDKTELEILCYELQEEWFCWAEGLGSGLGDPSGTARDIDIIIADYSMAKDDAEKALEAGNWYQAYSALNHILQVEYTYYNNFISDVGDIDLLRELMADTEGVYERADKLRKKAEADVKEANEKIDEAVDLFNGMLSYLAAAREKANELNHSDIAVILDVDTELKDDFRFERWEHETFDFDRLYYAVLDGKARNVEGFFPGILDELPDLFPEFFITANDLTSNGTEQPLVTPGKILPEGDGGMLYALGNKPDDMYPDLDWTIDVPDSELPEESYFKEEIPTAKDPGTYYVYCKFPNGKNLVKAVTVKEAQPDPSEEKKDNPLYAKGKTVKVKYSKKKNRTVKRAKAFTVRDAQGAVTFKKAKGNKKITVAKNGKITVKKGLKKGTYKIKIKVTAAGNNEYKAATKTVTVTIKVK